MLINCILRCQEGRSIGMCIFLFGHNGRAMLNYRSIETKYAAFFSFGYKRGRVQAGSCHSPSFLHITPVIAFGISFHLLCFRCFQQWVRLPMLPTCVAVAAINGRVPLGKKVRAINQSRFRGRKVWIAFEQAPTSLRQTSLILGYLVEI